MGEAHFPIYHLVDITGMILCYARSGYPDSLDLPQHIGQVARRNADMGLRLLLDGPAADALSIGLTVPASPSPNHFSPIPS